MSSLTSSKPKIWSKEQNEVWQCVEDHWDHLISGRVDDFLKYIHPDFLGFGHESPTKIAICELRPVDIRIHGDIAIVQYFIFTIEKNDEGGKRVIRRYTMTWQKGKDRWVVIGSHNNLMDETIRR